MPKNRPRSLKRIPQLQQFAPVIALLFAKAYDPTRRGLRKATFTFEDVRNAISATGVNLHWVRKDTFLAEIARSRRVAEMLAPALERGYSILPCTEGNAIGRFVSAGTPGTLDVKDTLHVRIDAIHDADRLPLRAINLNGTGWGVVAILSQAVVQQRLWGRQDCVVGLIDGENKPETNGNLYSLTLRKAPRFKVESISVITCKTGALPTKSRIAKIAKELRSKTVTVLVAATSKHLVALRFADCLSNPKEIARAAFELDRD